MTPYRLKHVPTGLYFQPYKYRGSNMSTKGKIYQTKTHGLSSAFKYAERYKDDERYQVFTVHCAENSQVFKLTKDKIAWKPNSWKTLKADTLIKDWITEPITISE